jgi:hypothetical protein
MIAPGFSDALGDFRPDAPSLTRTAAQLISPQRLPKRSRRLWHFAALAATDEKMHEDREETKAEFHSVKNRGYKLVQAKCADRKS